MLIDFLWLAELILPLICSGMAVTYVCLNPANAAPVIEKHALILGLPTPTFSGAFNVPAILFLTPD